MVEGLEVWAGLVKAYPYEGSQKQPREHDRSKSIKTCNSQPSSRNLEKVNVFTLGAGPRPEALEGIAIRCCKRSRRGGTGGREACGAIENGEGGRSTYHKENFQKVTLI